MSGVERIRVLVADDHPVVRLGIEAILRTQRDMQLVAQAADGNEAVRQALLTQPDVIVLDMDMPLKDGVTALLEIKQALPAIRCLMLTSVNDSQEVLQAIKAGAAGCLLKDVGPDELLRAIRAVYHGAGALDPATTRQLIDAVQSHQGTPVHEAKFTAAEVRVLRLLTRGLSNRELANQLGVSERTVTTHIRHILHKVGAQNRVQAALYARDHGLTM
jgi:DNA-binding NarL/FixJ family response regulator